MIVIQTAIDHRAMTTLARVSRKTLRRGRSGPVRTLAWFVVALEAFLTVSYLRGGFGGWLPNTLMGLFMLGCLLLEDRINGAFLLRRIEPERRTVNVTFSDEHLCLPHPIRGEPVALQSDQADCRDRGVLCPAAQPEPGTGLQQVGPQLGHSRGIAGSAGAENRPENPACPVTIPARAAPGPASGWPGKYIHSQWRFGRISR